VGYFSYHIVAYSRHAGTVTEICKHGDYATIRKRCFPVPCRVVPCRTAPRSLIGSAAVNSSRQHLIDALLGNVSVDATIMQQWSKLCFPLVRLRVYRRDWNSCEVNSCGGGVEYLHRDPASRKRRRNGKSQT
jgi:hypothetical protein